MVRGTHWNGGDGDEEEGEDDDDGDAGDEDFRNGGTSKIEVAPSFFLAKSLKWSRLRSAAMLVLKWGLKSSLCLPTSGKDGDAGVDNDADDNDADDNAAGNGADEDKERFRF